MDPRPLHGAGIRTAKLPTPGLPRTIMPVRVSFVVRCVVSSAALALLAGCPLAHLIDPSSVNSVTIDPDPVPGPTANATSNFNVTVAFDSERDNDRLRILMRNPHDDDRYKIIGEPEPCPGRRSGGGCGTGSITVVCNVQVSPFAGERSVGCGTSRIDMPPGDYTLRVEISSDVNFGPDDTYNATVRIR